MMLRLPLSGKRHTTIASAYAPTMTNPDEVKDKFYDDLDFVTSWTDKFILLRDFNASVGTDHQSWEGVIGIEGVGKCKSSDLKVRKCAEHDLLITNTFYRLLTRKRTSLETLASHCLYHSAKEGQTGCQNDKDYMWCGLLDTGCGVSKLNLRIQPVRRPQGKKVPKRLDISKLKRDRKRQAFINDICSRLDAQEHSSEDLDENWTVFRDTVHSSAINFLGPVSRKH